MIIQIVCNRPLELLACLYLQTYRSSLVLMIIYWCNFSFRGISGAKANNWGKCLILFVTALFIGMVKVRRLPSNKNCFICFNESSLNMMKNAFHFILKALNILKIFNFFSWLFTHVEKTSWLTKIWLLSKSIVSQPC